ncbi:uncharacterized protein [Notamacropus eugenii]|uniref:uncharacterized protein n=1 Tax=Notamacropus eugenii TaxID=9315 RepID=UPI003B67F5CD
MRSAPAASPRRPPLRSPLPQEVGGSASRGDAAPLPVTILPGVTPGENTSRTAGAVPLLPSSAGRRLGPGKADPEKPKQTQNPRPAGHSPASPSPRAPGSLGVPERGTAAASAPEREPQRQRRPSLPDPSRRPDTFKSSAEEAAAGAGGPLSAGGQAHLPAAAAAAAAAGGNRVHSPRTPLVPGLRPSRPAAAGQVLGAAAALARRLSGAGPPGRTSHQGESRRATPPLSPRAAAQGDAGLPGPGEKPDRAVPAEPERRVPEQSWEASASLARIMLLSA